MNKRVRRLLLQVFSSLNALFLTFQPLAALPVLLANPAVVQAEASVNANAVDLTFDEGSHEFRLRVKTDQALPYVLTYLDEKQDPQVEQAAQGNLEKMDEGVFGADVYAGTCSGGVCTPVTFLRGTLVIGESFKNSFQFINGAIVFDGQNPAVEQVCVNLEEVGMTAGEMLWSVDEATGVAETKNKVQPGVSYQFPLDDAVSVTFSCLPKDENLRSPLKIQQVLVSELNLPDSIKTDATYAYDITTEMENGTFEYELTLPKAKDAEVAISYIEKTIEEAKTTLSDQDVKTVIDSVDTKVEQLLGAEEISAIGLDHFTIFIATYSNNSFSVEKSSYKQGEVVYANSTSLQNNNSTWYRIDLIEPGGITIYNIGACSRNISSKNASYSLPSNATQGTWVAKITKHDSSSECGSSSDIKDTGTDTFDVTVGDYPELTVTKTNDVNSALTLGSQFKWTLHVTNSGNKQADFDENETILVDNLPSNDSAVSYDSPTVDNLLGITENGGIICSISSSENLTCKVSQGSGTRYVDIAPSGSFDVSFIVTPLASGVLTNPRAGGSNKCQVDPDSHVAESNELNNNCSDAVTIEAITPAPNPSLSQACGLDIALVLDSSGSIDSGELSTMKTAFNAFVNALLPGTPTQFSVTDFDSTAAVLQTFSGDTTTVQNAINTPTSGGSTNWEDGLVKAQSTLPNRSNPDLVLFASDGNPNRVDNGSTVSESQAVTEAVLVANAIKASGARVVALGIGNDLDVNNLKAISGPTVGTDLSADVITSDFATLASTLATFAAQTCGGAISVNKYIGTVSDATRGDNNWMFNVTGPNNYSNNLGTDPNGQASTAESGKLTAGSGYSIVEVTNQIPSGYNFTSATCRDQSGAPIGTAFIDNSGNPGLENITVGDNVIISCDFVNSVVPTASPTPTSTPSPTPTATPTPEPGTITIIKNVVPDDTSVWDFTVSPPGNIALGYMDMADGGSHTFNDLVEGSYTITESTSDGYSTSVSCTNNQTSSNNSVSFTLANGEDITCTFTNTKTAFCGDGITNNQEQCDYGQLNGQSSCSNECTWVNECRETMVADSSFETPMVSQGAGWDVFDNAEMTGWSAAWYGGSASYNGHDRPEPQVELHRGVNGWLPASGSQYVELDTDWTGPVNDFSGEPASIALSQNIPTIVGNEYTVSWKYSARPNHANNHLQVMVGGTEVFNSGVIAGGSNTNWQTQSYTFVATTTLTEIRFTELGRADSLGMFVDDIQVACNGLPSNDVTVCKEDSAGNPLTGWKVGLSQPTGFDEQIPVNSGAGVSTNLSAGAYIIYASGTYRYGNSAMIADAGYSFRPVGIPYGTGGWVSGDDLLSVPGALELKVNGGNVTWGGFNNLHQYAYYLTGFEGDLNLAIWDDNYGDNANNGNFRAQIDRQMFAGMVGENGCVTFSDVPYGDYHVFEAPVEDWAYQSTTVGGDVITNYPATATVGEQVPEITLTNKFVGGGTIRIVKDVTPDDTQTKFDYTLSNTAGYSVSDKVWEGNPSGYVNLPVGTYTLSEVDLPEYIESISCSNDQVSTSNSITFNLTTGDDINCTITNSRHGSLSGKKYIDNNSDGQFNPADGDTLYQGWVIKLYKYSGTNFAYTTETTTDANGEYLFENLDSGTYSIEEVLTDNHTAIEPNNSGTYNPVELSLGENLTGFDFGNFESGDMDVWKYEDTDAILGRSGNETWIGDPTFTFRVYLDENGGVAGGWVLKSTASTNSEGKAEFANVFDSVGQYYVCEVQRDGWEDMRSRHNTANNESGALDEYTVCDGITVPGSGYARSAEFGNIHKGLVTVNKFHDRNTNGVYDDGEELMSGWDMSMEATSGFLATQTTSSGGSTQFSLDPNTYFLSETPQEGWEQSNIYCTDESVGNMITAQGEACGHHGACSGWNGCGDAATCAQWACEVNGYDYAVSYGAEKPCTEYQSCNLFYSRGSVQMGWGNWCPVMGVTDIQCGNYSGPTATPTPTPIQDADASNWLDKVLGVTQANVQPAPDPEGYRVVVNPGANKTCYVGNYQPGSIQGRKYFDDNQNGDFEDDESKMQYWGISLSGEGVDEQVVTDENGGFSFTNLKKGTYTLCEEDRTEWGWQVTEPAEPIDTVCREVVIDRSGETEVANFGNFIESRLYILKTNNAWPTDVTIGDEVTYTIRVMAVGGPVYDATVLDVPPAQLTYVPDSYTAESSDGTDLRADGTTGDPNYQSPGKWTLGDLDKDEIVTLTYKAKVGTLADPGVYPDMVWATGTSEQSRATEGETDDLLALSDPDFSSNSGGVDFDGSQGHFGEDNFAGTQVAVVLDQTPFSEYQVGKTEEKQGDVLGASTELPATGARTWLTLLALISIVAGAGFLIMGKRSRNSGLKTLVGLFVVGFSLWFAQPAQALTSVRVEEPYNNSAEFTLDAITNQTTMKIDFVVLNTDNISVTAQCQQQRNDGAWSNITTNYTVKAGGNSGYCEAKDLEHDQNYDFRVVVSGDGPDKISDEVRVGLDTNRPDKPVNYSKNPGNYCEDKIGFKTANDGQTSSVEVYRSTDNDHFTAKPDTRVITIPIGPNQEYTLTTSKPNCDDTYYYVIRAFDVNGNASDLVGDLEIKTVIIESASGTTQTVQLGAIPAGSAFIAGGSTTDETAEGTTGEGEEEIDEPETTAEPTETESTEGTVLGSATETLMSFLTRFGLPIGVGLIVLAGLYIIFFGKRNEK